MRWHQRLGLGFGALASTWLFSGALSLEPFDWASSDVDPARPLYDIQASAALEQQLTRALAHCRSQLQGVRELELLALGHLYALCSDARAQTRLVDLEDPALAAHARIPHAQLAALALRLRAELTVHDAPDAYYYPTQRRPIALPYARLSLHDEADSALYIDPARARVVAQLDTRKRLERWLFHGLHSWDFPVLYRWRALWQGVLLAAMALGLTLALLGGLIVVRRQRLTRRRVRAASRRAAAPQRNG